MCENINVFTSGDSNTKMLTTLFCHVIKCMLLAVATNNIGKGTQLIPRGRCRQFERKRCTRCALNLSHFPTSNPAVTICSKAAQKGGLERYFFAPPEVISINAASPELQGVLSSKERPEVSDLRETWTKMSPSDRSTRLRSTGTMHNTRFMSTYQTHVTDTWFGELFAARAAHVMAEEPQDPKSAQQMTCLLIVLSCLCVLVSFGY